MEIQDLTAAQCVLLAVHLASTEANVASLHTLVDKRNDCLPPELVLRIVLTYLPESTPPQEYVGFVGEVASRLYLHEREDVVVNTSAVNGMSDEEAKKRAKRLPLLPLTAPDLPPHVPRDTLIRFLFHRAYRIDQETGMIGLLPALLEPFLDRSPFLRTWYIEIVLPMLRITTDYYPEIESLAMPLSEFQKLSGREGVDVLLKQSIQSPGNAKSTVCRDIKGLVGPWMYGCTERKRRKLDYIPTKARINSFTPRDVGELEEHTSNLKIGLGGIKSSDKATGHDWEGFFQWMVHNAAEHFDLISMAVERWDGPSDIDLGSLDRGGVAYLDDDLLRKLDLQYAQAAFASCYVVTADTRETIEAAHAILARLAELLDFIPPPDLATTVDSLPKVERYATKLDESQTLADLHPAALLRPEHPLTTPRIQTYMLLQLFVYSAYQFSGLDYPLSITNVAKTHFYASGEEQLDVLRKILRGLAKPGSRKGDTQWNADRAKLIWLWNWGVEGDPDRAEEGFGVLGKISKDDFEAEMLKVFVDSSGYRLVTSHYLEDISEISLSKPQVKGLILAKAMEAYDAATNGNKTRGGMRKANDIITTFRPYFPDSLRFRQASALIAATHALSFYSLTLQHGVPFLPVSIRVSHDPIALISKTLEQNPRSFDQLDNLIEIARNLVSAGLEKNEDGKDYEADGLVRRQKEAERRVTFMAVEAALREDDFETAYSYIVNRLTPSGVEIEAPNNTPQHRRQRSSRIRNQVDYDDVSWRAAFLAGRYRPSSSTTPTLRRLEQRTELLSLALLLAPISSLTEILAAWRRCEEEMTSLQQSQQQAEEDFDDRADKRLSGNTSTLPGNFTVANDQPELILNQKRREVGRMGAARTGNDETPLSMFDLTRSAARAFSKTATSLQGAGTDRPLSGEYKRSMEESVTSAGSESSADALQRVRKRDMVANAVSGGLASGIGWVLGATPAQHHQGEEDEHI